MPNEDQIVITEIAPDGTETIVEITSSAVDDNADEPSLVEEVIEAIFDTDINDDGNVITVDEVGAGDPVIFETVPTVEEISTNSAEFTIGEDMFPAGDAPFEMPATDTAFEPEFVSAPMTDMSGGYDADTEIVDPALAEQQAQVEAAKDAQAAADEFVAQGDYAAAAEAREAAEEAAYAAGDDSMLGASDSSDLENAAYQQEVAEEYRVSQAENIAEGDFEAAKEDAQNAGYATGDADYLAGGADHTGQSDNDVYNLDWAVYQDKNADQSALDAEVYAAQGDFENAEIAADRAEEYGTSAVDFAAQGDPSSILNDVDPSSAVMTGGEFDAGGLDAGGFDSSIAAVDTGFDASVDMSTPTFDTTTDDTV